MSCRPFFAKKKKKKKKRPTKTNADGMTCSRALCPTSLTAI